MVLEVACLAESRFKVFAKVQFQANFEIADYLPDQVNRNNYGDQAVERVMRQLVSRPVFLSNDGRKVDLNVFAAMFLGVRCALNSSSDKYVKIIADLKKRGLDIETYYTHTIGFLIVQMIEPPQRYAGIRDLEPLPRFGAFNTPAFSLVESLIETAKRSYLEYLENILK